MVDWLPTALILFSCVAANHLGLVAAAERTVRHRLPLVNCPKCLTFWSTLAYGLSGDGIAALPSALPRLLAISFMASYIAIWLELLMYAIDTFYNRIYDTLKDNNQEYNSEDDDGKAA